MTGKDEKHLSQLASSKKRKKLPETMMTDQFKQFIVSVNGLDDRESIRNLVENMPTMDTHYLRVAYRKVAPNIDLSQLVECSTCGHEMEMMVPFTAEFFWPKR